MTAGAPLLLRVGFSNSGCPSAPDAKASLNGTSLTPVTLGGPAGTGPLAGCNAIQFSGAAPAPAADPVTFTVVDSTKTLSMTLPDYFGPRSLTIVSPVQGIHMGDSVSLQANPSSDNFDATTGVGVQFVPDADGGPVFVVKQAQFAGSTVTFTVPSVAGSIPDGGASGQLSLEAGETFAQVSTCSGATACTATLATQYSAPTQLLP